MARPKTEVVEVLPERSEPLTGWTAIINKALDRPEVSVELLGKLFELQQKALAEMQRKAFVEAFTAFKSQAPAAITRTGHVGYEGAKGRTDYDHVQLDVAAAQLTPILSAHGLAHSWESSQDDKGMLTVSCRLEHVAGHARTVTLRGMPDTSGSKNPLQAIGSAQYYLERYTFLAVLGIAQAGADTDAVGEPELLTFGHLEEIKGLLERLSKYPKRVDEFWNWVHTFCPCNRDPDKIEEKLFSKIGDALEKAARKAESQ